MHGKLQNALDARQQAVRVGWLLGEIAS